MKMVKTRIMVDDKTGERFMLSFDSDGILVAFEKMVPGSPSPRTPLPAP